MLFHQMKCLFLHSPGLEEIAKMAETSPNTDGKNQYSVRSVERALTILKAFSLESGELTLGEVARAASLSKPTAFRLLFTLEKERFVALDHATGRYCLGSKFLELGGIAISSLTLRKTARQFVNRLNEESGATILMGIFLENRLVYVDKRDGHGQIRIVSDIGWRRDIHFGMLGAVLLAHMDPKLVDELLTLSPLAHHTRHSIVNRKLFDARLLEIRRQGYCLEFNEAIEGVWGVASPVHDFTGRVVAAVGASLPLSEASDGKIAQMTLAVPKCAAAISQALGHHRPSDLSEG